MLGILLLVAILINGNLTRIADVNEKWAAEHATTPDDDDSTTTTT